MNAIGYRASHPASNLEALIEVDPPLPQAIGRDLREKVNHPPENPARSNDGRAGFDRKLLSAQFLVESSRAQ